MRVCYVHVCVYICTCVCVYIICEREREYLSERKVLSLSLSHTHTHTHTHTRLGRGWRRQMLSITPPPHKHTHGFFFLEEADVVSNPPPHTRLCEAKLKGLVEHGKKLRRGKYLLPREKRAWQSRAQKSRRISPFFSHTRELLCFRSCYNVLLIYHIAMCYRYIASTLH